MTELSVFAVQLIYVLLLGLQSQNVQQRRYGLAGGVSLMLGVIGFYTTVVIAQSALRDNPWSGVFVAYILAGPVGIMLSIWLQPKLVRRYQKWIK